MRIPVESIPRTGRTIELRLDADWSREAAAAALDLEPTALSGKLEIAPPPKTGLITIEVEVRAGAACACHRCGEGFEFTIETEAELRYLPNTSNPSDEEVELRSEELEIGWYEDGVIDLAAILQEAIALELPARYTCADVEACDARTQALLDAAKPEKGGGHPGFAVLKDLTH